MSCRSTLTLLSYQSKYRSQSCPLKDRTVKARYQRIQLIINYVNVFDVLDVFTNVDSRRLVNAFRLLEANEDKYFRIILASIRGCDIIRK